MSLLKCILSIECALRINITVIFIIATSTCFGTSRFLNFNNLDILTPYVHRHGSRLNHRSIRECQPEMFGNEAHELYLAHKSSTPLANFIHIKRFVKEIKIPTGSKLARGYYAAVLDPLRTISVLEPNQKGGCGLSIRQTVRETSHQRQCVLAVNAGFFDTKTGKCLGNVVSDGRIVQDSGGIQNAHFGLTKNGSIFLGYLSEEELSRGGSGFMQLVGGVVWILRQGQNFVNASKFLECEDTEETGTMDKFVNILSARTAIGHDKIGRVIIVQVDGKTGKDGLSLWEMEDLLKDFGLVNAINLDGGGSATFVVNGTVLNYPSDSCLDEQQFACDRKVTTVVCVHPPDCNPQSCNNHGQCIMGECICEKNYLPPKCDNLICSIKNCSNHGHCTIEGCLCEAGWKGNDCNEACPEGWFGVECKHPCHCMNNGTCDPVSGRCKCKPGFIGLWCNHECPYGFFGQDCIERCTCGNSCFCDPVSGSCENKQNSSLQMAGYCLAKKLIQEQHLVQENHNEERKWFIIVIVLSIITAISIASGLLLIFYSCTCSCKSRRKSCFRNKKLRYREHYPLRMSERESSGSSSENEVMSVGNTENRS